MCRSVGSAMGSETAVTAATRRTVTEGHVTPSTSSHAIRECVSQPGEEIGIMTMTIIRMRILVMTKTIDDDD